MRYLIVNADDFGQTQGINDAIVLAHQEGILTSATIMANGDAFDEAVRISSSTPSLGVGVHLNLVQGIPVDKRRSSLTNAGGEFLGKWGFVRRYLAGKLLFSDVQHEVEAQLRRVIDAGINPTHIDSHQHMHVFPPLAGTIARVARSLGVSSVRLPLDRFRWSDVFRAGLGLVRATAINQATRMSRNALLASGLKTTDQFSGTLMTGAVSADWVKHWIRQLPPGATELMVHPGLPNDGDLESRLQTRELELNAITDPSVLLAAKEADVQLIHYGEFTQVTAKPPAN